MYSFCLDIPQFSANRTGRIPTAQEKWQKEIPVRENTGNLEILPKQGILCANTFPDSKNQDITLFAAKFLFFSVHKN